ncbi:uncharacterized protein LOC106660331 [Trichogramma pretiosum]|uniref:uncharacterized protein LOC106660331 n=1 Tax=Trichogramma pretiosum TaxID=7493 RepID=UPI000C718AB7|nr:uncharacterized protein LOC106660331 [Trichogramma pretiosum]
MESLLRAQEKLAQYIANFYKNSTEKLVCCEKDFASETYFTNDGYGYIEAEYISAKARIRDLLATALPSGGSGEASVGGSEIRIEQFSSLPSLALPKFSGKQEEWESFKQRFSSLVRDKEHIPNIAKLQHLLNAVQGPAALRLRGLEITEANFDVAWEKLMRRYDNRRIRLATTLENLIQLSAVKSRNAQELSELIDHSEEAVRSLKELQCPVEHYDAWIVHCVVRKLDTNSRESWEISRENCDELPSYCDLVNFLERRIHSLEQARPANESREAQTSRPRGSGQHHVFASSTQVQEDGSEGRIAPLCDLCQGGHWLHKCYKFLALSQAQRLDLCKKKKLCLNCLHKSHFADRCPSNLRCLDCRGKHHTKLHIDAVNRKIPRRRDTDGGYDDQGDTADPTAEDGSERSIVAHTTIATADVLLATAYIKIEAADGTSLIV